MLRKLLGSTLTKLRKLLVIARINQIKSRDFSIISSNCTGTLPYRFLDMPYTSPTINLYFMAPDYMRFIKHLDYYLAQPLTFVTHSRYVQAEKVRQRTGQYPIGMLDDIEIHFMHYSDSTDAAAKWNRRKQRINRNKLIFAFTDKDLCTPELLREFDSLPLANKFVFTANHHPQIKHSIQVGQYCGENEMGDAYTHYDALTHVNFTRLIDGPRNRHRRSLGHVLRNPTRIHAAMPNHGRQQHRLKTPVKTLSGEDNTEPLVAEQDSRHEAKTSRASGAI